MKISKCPTCGSRKIRLVVSDYRGNMAGKPFVVAAVEHHECPACGEKLYGPEAMTKIEAGRPVKRKSNRVA